jgi:hypothetical protein
MIYVLFLLDSVRQVPRGGPVGLALPSSKCKPLREARLAVLKHGQISKELERLVHW